MRTVKGMLPHNSLGAKTLTKLKVYAGPNHPHEAQIKGTPSSEKAQALAEAATRAMRRDKGNATTDSTVNAA
jgi:ribosomal protein L13